MSLAEATVYGGQMVAHPPVQLDLPGVAVSGEYV